MKNRTIILAAAFAVLTTLGYVASAQKMDHSGHGGMDMTKAPSNAQEAYEAANAKMHKDMTMTFTGDADVDFVRGMTPHHQGAVDMAKVVLQYGKDPELKKLATEIIKSQETEIAFMKGWMAKNGK
ncbi:MAG: DUF305 domain-containing protein [Hyphomicrobiales bacterium]|nr:DUF305 domain-containing protein [Hyphomicrobiales bacterium]